MHIYPAIDLRGGRCVRLRQGDYAQETVFGNDPAEMAMHWVNQGAGRLHIVDLDGARTGRPTNIESIHEILKAVSVPCQVGGGVRDQDSIAQLLDLGVGRVVIGTKALKDPQWFQQMCHQFPHQLALGIDARGGRVATDGWLETSETSAVALAQQFASQPLAALICTDIASDGMLAGPNIQAMQAVARAVDKPVIASGGVTTIADVTALAVAEMDGCIIGRALYEGRIDLFDALTAAGDNPPEVRPPPRDE